MKEEFADQVTQFVRAATDETPGPVEGPFLEAKRMLAREPALATADVYTALVLGDVEAVRRQIERDGDWVRRKGGPQPGREPLLYVTYSKFHRESPERAEGLLATARLLLDAGADPDAWFTNDSFPDSPLGALVGACGAANFPAMAGLLLDRGTTIDDHESLYHSTEHADTRCLELLLARGANPLKTNALNHAFDVPGLERTRLLLEHGTDPNEVYGYGGAALHGAIDRGREVALLELLVAHGADIHARRADGRSPYRVALHNGHHEAAAWLAKLGAATEATPFERFADACGRGDLAAARRELDEHPGLLESLSPGELHVIGRLAGQGRAAALAAMIDLGVPSMRGEGMTRRPPLGLLARLAGCREGAAGTGSRRGRRGEPVRWHASRLGRARLRQLSEPGGRLSRCGAASARRGRGCLGDPGAARRRGRRRRVAGGGSEGRGGLSPAGGGWYKAGMETSPLLSPPASPDSFQALALSEPLLRAVAEVGYEAPTPIQIAAIPPLLAGRDLIGQAQTGTGKTAAFGLPLLQAIDPAQRSIQALVLTPTRELAIQVAEALHSYGKNLQGLVVLPVYGGHSLEDQTRRLQRGVHVVVGTPGRIMDHLRRGTLRLDRLRMVVLDEADEMLRMGFIEDVEWILAQGAGVHGRAADGALLGHHAAGDPARRPAPPARAGDPAARPQDPHPAGHHPALPDDPPGAEARGAHRLLEIEPTEAVLVFTRTKNAAAQVAERLEARGYSVAALHGDMGQPLRERVIDRLRNGSVEIVVATDVAARGLDVERISHVVNYDVPNDVEAYVHRIGRTGRAGRPGIAVLFVTPRERRMLQDIERFTGQRVEPMKMPTPADVAARRSELFKESLRKAIGEGELELYLTLVEDLVEEGFEIAEIAAAAAYLARRERPLVEVAVEPEARELPGRPTAWCASSSTPAGRGACGRRTSWEPSPTKRAFRGGRSAPSTSTTASRWSRCRPASSSRSSRRCPARHCAGALWRSRSPARTASIRTTGHPAAARRRGRGGRRCGPSGRAPARRGRSGPGDPSIDHPMTILETWGLTKRFGDVTAVDDFTIAMPEGEAFGLLGPNGAGKTTIIRMLTTLLPPSAGSARIAGCDLRREPMGVRRAIGYVPQAISVDGALTAYENLLIFSKLYDIPRRERAGRIEYALALVGLTEAAGRLVREFSGA